MSQQAPAPQPGQEQPSPLFSVPLPPSDAARWLQMVQGPFLANSPPAPAPPQAGPPAKTARANLLTALREGRWQWMRKLACPARVLSALLVKVADDGVGPSGRGNTYRLDPSRRLAPVTHYRKPAAGAPEKLPQVQLLQQAMAAGRQKVGCIKIAQGWQMPGMMPGMGGMGVGEE